MVRSTEMRSNTARNESTRSRPMMVLPGIPLNRLAYVVTFLLALLAIYAIMGHVVTFGWGVIDDVRYGTPRTYQMAAVVGHEDGEGTPTHFIAMNLNRQVVVLEMPGGDASKIRTLTGPYLFGAGEDKTPVLLRLDDLNRDGADDLVVSIKNEEIVYVNRDGQFQPISAEERATLMEDQGK